MFHTLDLIIDENDDKIHVNHVQSTNCINVNVAGGVHNQCMNHTMATGNNTSERPHHTNYSIESIRIISFNNWPQFKHQTPQQLAEAGFFYAGNEARSFLSQKNFTLFISAITMLNGLQSQQLHLLFLLYRIINRLLSAGKPSEYNSNNSMYTIQYFKKI